MGHITLLNLQFEICRVTFLEVFDLFEWDGLPIFCQ